LSFPQRLSSIEQQKPCAIARHIIDGESEFIELLLLAHRPIRNGCAEAAALHHPGGFGCRSGRQLQRLWQMLGQPTTALRKSLWMRQHFADALQRATAQQRMTNGQHQSAADAELTMGPERIQAGGDPALNGVLNRHHGSLAAAIRHMLHHRAQSGASHQISIAELLQPHHGLGSPLAIGALWPQKRHPHRHGSLHSHR